MREIQACRHGLGMVLAEYVEFGIVALGAAETAVAEPNGVARLEAGCAGARLDHHPRAVAAEHGRQFALEDAAGPDLGVHGVYAGGVQPHLDLVRRRDLRFGQIAVDQVLQPARCGHEDGFHRSSWGWMGAKRA